MPGPVPEQPSLISQLGGNKAVIGMATYEAGQKLYEKGKSFWNEHFAYTVKVEERDLLYPEVHNWLMSIMPNEKHHALKVSSRHGSTSEETETSDESENEARVLQVRFDDTASRLVVIDGHRVRVSLHQPDVDTSQSMYTKPKEASILFTCRSYQAQQIVINHLNRLIKSRSTERKAVLRMVGMWGSWSTRSDLPPRTLESVALPGDQMERIIEDMGEFLDSEERYNRLALAWHRGYMFHGPPGTGKTSLVKALANHFNLDLWYISLADLEKEASLLGLLADVGPRSILLLEDIDTMRITQNRETEKQGTISMSSLLNVLDGVATPHGLITVMTTNRFDVLDAALTREGRMDLIEDIGYPTIGSLSALFYHFYGRLPEWAAESERTLDGLAVSKVSEVFKRRLKDPDGAESEIKNLLHAYLPTT